MIGGHAPAAPVAAAMVEVGECSGVLVAPDVVLTSAHCLERPIDHVALAGSDAAVTACEKHPEYQSMQPPHDIGFCRLAAPVAAGFVPIEDASDAAPGELVTLVGYGHGDPFARTPRALQAVDSTVARVANGTIVAGAKESTACRGDSGGPVLVARGGEARVAGIIHGPTGAICASPTEATLVRGHLAWLDARAGLDAPARSGWRGAALGVVAAVIVAAIVLLFVVRRRRAIRRARVGEWAP